MSQPAGIEVQQQDIDNARASVAAETISRLIEECASLRAVVASLQRRIVDLTTPAPAEAETPGT